MRTNQPHRSLHWHIHAESESDSNAGEFHATHKQWSTRPWNQCIPRGSRINLQPGTGNLATWQPAGLRPLSRGEAVRISSSCRRFIRNMDSGRGSECLSKGALVAVIRPTEILAAQTQKPKHSNKKTEPPSSLSFKSFFNSFFFCNNKLLWTKVPLQVETETQRKKAELPQDLSIYLTRRRRRQIWKFVGFGGLFFFFCCTLRHLNRFIKHSVALYSKSWAKCPYVLAV